MSKDGKITIKDIAEMAGVSKTTVSFYLNGKKDKMSIETCAKIQQIIEETNYRPNIAARTLNQKRSGLIGVIIGDITNTFSNKIVKGIEGTAREHGYQILVGNSGYDVKEESSYVERMLTLGVDGFIIQPSASFHELSERLRRLGKPYVYFDSKLYEEDHVFVKTDNYEATENAVEELVKRGYRHFAMIGADPKLLSTRIERSKGFTDAVEKAGYTVENFEIRDGEISSDAVLSFVKSQITDDAPLLVYVPNCWALPSVYEALQPIRDMIPKKVGIIGFDNTEWASFASPRVTTIVQPAFMEGDKAARLLIDQIEETNQEPIHQTLRCSVHWSESTL